MPIASRFKFNSSTEKFDLVHGMNFKLNYTLHLNADVKQGHKISMASVPNDRAYIQNANEGESEK